MKNALIVTLALIVVGGGFFIGGQKVEEKKQQAPQTTDSQVAVEAPKGGEAPQTTAKVGSEETVAEPKPVTPEEPVAEPQTVVGDKEKKPVAETQKEAVKPEEKAPETEASVNTPPQKAENKPESSKKISRDEAKKIALKHAGLKEADVRGLEIELDFERGAYEYEVSFESGKYDYDYDIDALTGKIKFSEKEIDN